MRHRILRTLFWLAPVIAFVAIYWDGLNTWFQQDDFAWLGLAGEYRDGRPLLDLLFRPMAQGTVRPVSERLYYLILTSNFGLNAIPFHAVAFVTHSVSLILLQWIALRASGSRLVAIVPPMMWLCSASLATPLSWVATYNQVLCACLLLGALACLVKALDSGQKRWWVGQAVLFTISLGALEIAVVYPAICAAWVALFARDQWKKTLPLFAIALVYLVCHFAFVTTDKAGVYARHWDASILTTYARYWGSVVASIDPGQSRHGRTIARLVLVSISLLGIMVWAWRRGERLAAFGFLWFTITIGPVLPLRDHLSHYYSAIPAVGVALMFGALVQRVKQLSWLWRIAGLVLVCAHVWLCLPVTMTITAWHRARGDRVRVLVEGLERAHQLHPGSAIFIAGVDNDLYWASLAHKPQRLVGATQVALLPGEAKDYIAYPEVCDFTRDVASEVMVARGIAWNSAKVYSYEEHVLRDITTRFWDEMPKGWLWTRPRMVDVAQPAFARDIGSGWYPIEGTWRWMGKRATIYLAPIGAGDWDMYVAGFNPGPPSGSKEQVLTVRVGSKIVGEVEIAKQDAAFEALLPLEDVQRTDPLEIVLEVAQTARIPGDARDFGLIFGQIGLRPRSPEVTLGND